MNLGYFLFHLVITVVSFSFQLREKLLWARTGTRDVCDARNATRLSLPVPMQSMRGNPTATTLVILLSLGRPVLEDPEHRVMFINN